MNQTPTSNNISRATGLISSRLSRPIMFGHNHQKLSPVPFNKQQPQSASQDSSETQSSSILPINTDEFKIGDRVWVGGVKPGIIAFIGEVQFAPGEWAGVVLDSPVGKNDGSVNGSRYFMCEPKRGIFSTLSKLTKTYVKNFSPASNDTKSQTESSDNTSEKSQKSIEHRKGLKNTKELLTSCPKKAEFGANSTDGSAIVDKKSSTADIQINQIEMKTSITSFPSTTSALPRRKASIGSGSSHSSDKNEGSSSGKVNASFKIGDLVLVSGSKDGIVRFIGEADFAKGIWVGVELNESLGKNDGSVAGKRYFNCAPMRGLFAPLHKVELCKNPNKPPYLQHQQRSHPRTQQSTGSGTAVSHSSSHNSSFTGNRGSQESISSIGSAASSASRRMKLGVTSLGNHMTRNKGPLYGTPTLSALQKTLKEKEEHIEQLIKERDMDRTEFIRTAAQIDEVESQLLLMQSEKRKFMEEMEERLRHAEDLIFSLEGEKNDLKMQLIEERRKYEDLQFSLEEVNIEKSDIQSQIEKDAKRLTELDLKLKNEMHLNDKLSNELKSLRMIGTNKDDPIDEYLDQIEELTHKLCMAENKLKAFESEGIQVKSVDLCRNCSQSMSSAEENHGETISSGNDLHLLPTDSKTLKNQLRSVTQEKLFVEAQKLELEEDLKKVSAEKDLIELELNNLIDDHKKALGEREKLLREKSSNQKLIHEAGVQIREFEQKVEKLTCDYAFKIENLRERAEAAELETRVLQISIQQLTPLKEQVEKLTGHVQILTKERDAALSEIQKLKSSKAEKKQAEGQSLDSKSKVTKDSKQFKDSKDEIINDRNATIDELKKEIQQMKLMNREANNLQQRIRELEQLLKESGIDKSNNGNNNIANNNKQNNNTANDNKAGGDSNGVSIVGASLIEKLKSEKDFAESQVEFLNAVIIDLQRKNTELESRLNVMEESSRSMTDSTSEPLLASERKKPAPRLFCDICDIFDQHETEDCPKQNMTSSPMNASQYHGSHDDERPYCATCEVFGHMTDQCKDEQTF